MQGKEHLLEINGEVKSINAWSVQYGMNESTVRGRLQKGVDPLTALTAPLGTTFKKAAVRKRRADPKERCMKCKYRNFLDHAHTKGQVYCEYMYHVGHRRPCPAKDCTAMVPGPMLKVRVQPFVTHERGWEENGYTEIG